MRRMTLLVGAVVVAVVLAAGASGSMGSVQARWVIRDLGVLSGAESSAQSVNDRDQIVGVSKARSGAHVFLWEKGRMTDLGTLGGAFSGDYMTGGGGPVLLNERGQVAGSSETSSGVWHAFLWQKGRMRDLGTLGGGESFSVAINEGGQVVGKSDFATPLATVEEHAFLWANGRMRDLGRFPRGDESVAAGINAKGQVVGASRTGVVKHGVDVEHAFLWQNGKMRDLGAIRSGWESYATAINDRGQIIGHSERPYGSQHGFLWQNGRMLDLGGVPSAINNSGQIVGTTGTGGPGHAFLWEKGKMCDLGTLGGRSSYARAINQRGQIVGGSNTKAKSTDGSPFWHAFLWQNGSMVDLGTLGGNESDAVAINNHGEIVGWATTKTGHKHAVLWTLRSG